MFFSDGLHSSIRGNQHQHAHATVSPDLFTNSLNNFLDIILSLVKTSACYFSRKFIHNSLAYDFYSQHSLHYSLIIRLSHVLSGLQYSLLFPRNLFFSCSSLGDVILQFFVLARFLTPATDSMLSQLRLLFLAQTSLDSLPQFFCSISKSFHDFHHSRIRFVICEKDKKFTGSNQPLAFTGMVPAGGSGASNSHTAYDLATFARSPTSLGPDECKSVSAAIEKGSVAEDGSCSEGVACPRAEVRVASPFRGVACDGRALVPTLAGTSEAREELETAGKRNLLLESKTSSGFVSASAAAAAPVYFVLPDARKTVPISGTSGAASAVTGALVAASVRPPLPASVGGGAGSSGAALAVTGALVAVTAASVRPPLPAPGGGPGGLASTCYRGSGVRLEELITISQGPLPCVEGLSASNYE